MTRRRPTVHPRDHENAITVHPETRYPFFDGRIATRSMYGNRFTPALTAVGGMVDDDRAAALLATREVQTIAK